MVSFRLRMCERSTAWVARTYFVWRGCCCDSAHDSPTQEPLKCKEFIRMGFSDFQLESAASRYVVLRWPGMNTRRRSTPRSDRYKRERLQWPLGTNPKLAPLKAGGDFQCKPPRPSCRTTDRILAKRR